jgi:DNA-binding phage protein
MDTPKCQHAQNRNEAEIAAYIEAMLEDGDACAVPIALRTVAEAVGGMAALADKTAFP